MFQCVQRGCLFTADLAVPLSKMLSVKNFVLLKKKKYPRTFLFAVYCIFCIFLSRLLCLFPPGCRLLPSYKLCPGARWTSQALWAQTRETGGSQPASYLTHTLAEQLSRWASLKPWGRPEGTMQRWHLHHRQHFTVYPSGWGNWSFTFHISAAWVPLS